MTSIVEPVGLSLVGHPAEQSRAADDEVPVNDLPALRAVGPGFDADRAPGPDVAQIALEHLAIARTPEVAAADPWGEAGRKILRFHLARMLAQVPATMAGEDSEADP